MKTNVLMRQHSFTERTQYHEEISEVDEFLLNNNGYIYTRTEYKHATKVARTLKINGTMAEMNSLLRKSPRKSCDDTLVPTATAIKEYEPKDSKENTKYKLSRKSSAPCITRKTSIARIGSAFRELQQTIKPRRVKGRQTTDCTFTGIEEVNQMTTNKKTVSRSVSLPNIKDPNNRRNSKKNTLLRKLSATQKQNKSTPVLDFESNDVISFPSNRLEAYRTKSQEKILYDAGEMNAINRRRKQGRSRSAQLPNDTIVRQLNRERSFSTDCDDHLFSFDKLVERRLNSSKETQLCETDL